MCPAINLLLEQEAEMNIGGATSQPGTLLGSALRTAQYFTLGFVHKVGINSPHSLFYMKD